MQTKQGSALQSLRSVQAFLDANATALAGVVASGARKRLDDLVASLDGHADTQSTGVLAAQGATQDHQALRAALVRDHMAPIARIAAAELPNSPGIEPLRMPKGRPSVERLKALAVGMATAAEPYAAVFTAAGLPDDFVAQLTAAADAMLQTVGKRRQSRVVVAGATSGLRTKLSSGRKLVHVLDALVKRALANDPDLLREWNVAKRVQLVPGGQPAAASPAPAPAPAPTPAPAPVPAAA